MKSYDEEMMEVINKMNPNRGQKAKIFLDWMQRALKFNAGHLHIKEENNNIVLTEITDIEKVEKAGTIILNTKFNKITEEDIQHWTQFFASTYFDPEEHLFSFLSKFDGITARIVNDKIIQFFEDLQENGVGIYEIL